MLKGLKIKLFLMMNSTLPSIIIAEISKNYFFLLNIRYYYVFYLLFFLIYEFEIIPNFESNNMYLELICSIAWKKDFFWSQFFDG
jgi:hypothetical protein